MGYGTEFGFAAGEFRIKAFVDHGVILPKFQYDLPDKVEVDFGYISLTFVRN